MIIPKKNSALTVALIYFCAVVVVSTVSSPFFLVNASIFSSEPHFHSSSSSSSSRSSSSPPPSKTSYCPSSCHCSHQKSLSDRIWHVFDYFAASLEVLHRAFALGFGIRMLKYILLQEDERIDSLRNRFWISSVSGLAMATFIYGGSMFIPTKLRVGWFDED